MDDAADLKAPNFPGTPTTSSRFQALSGHLRPGPITYVAPLAAPLYPALDMTCAHGVLWYMEPTGDQIAAEAAAGIE